MLSYQATPSLLHAILNQDSRYTLGIDVLLGKEMGLGA